MFMLKSSRLTENMVTFVKKRISLRIGMVQGKGSIKGRLGVVDVLDDCNPMRMPVQAVESRVGSSSPNTGGEVLPLSGVDSLSIDVVSLAAYDADFIIGKVDRRKIVEEMYPIEWIHLLGVHPVHGCREARRGSTSRQAGGLMIE